MITGAAFLLSLLFVQPFVGIIPDAATTCALVMVGVLSVVALKDVNFEDFTDQLTAFFTIATMGFVRVI
jgi:AGZA family xanthine/uracil permease-like MFS transporter